jgi:hypothetical protein
MSAATLRMRTRSQGPALSLAQHIAACELRIQALDLAWLSHPWYAVYQAALLDGEGAIVYRIETALQPHLAEKARLRKEIALLNGWIWCSGCSGCSES